jgi:xylose isomerase
MSTAAPPVVVVEEFFPTVPAVIPYKGPDSTDPLSFRHYNADEEILGRPMKDWLRFSVCFWHTFVGGGGQDPFGDKTLARPWEHGILRKKDDDDSGCVVDASAAEAQMSLARRRIDVAFEFMTKLGVPFYTFHDTDVAPVGASLAQFQQNLDENAKRVFCYCGQPRICFLIHAT